MKSLKRIKENIVQNFDWNTTSLLIIPIACLVEKMLYKFGYISNGSSTLGLATMLLPVVATNYCYREDRSRFEKGLFIFFSLYTMLILWYYLLFSGQPAIDKLIMLMSVSLCWVLLIIFFVFATIWFHNNKQLSASAIVVKKKCKVVIEWIEFIMIICIILLVNI